MTKIGMNLSGISYFSAQWCFANVIQFASPYGRSLYNHSVPSSRNLTFDENGYPKGLVYRKAGWIRLELDGSILRFTSPNHGLVVNDAIRIWNLKTTPSVDNTSNIIVTRIVDENVFEVKTNVTLRRSETAPGQYWEYQQSFGSVVWSVGEPHIPTGTYKLKFEGRGIVALTGDTQPKTYQSSGRAVEFDVPVWKGNGSLGFEIISSDPANHVRNIRLFPPGHDDGDKYHSKWLENLAPFDTLRFMDPSAVNNSNLRFWSERTLPGSIWQAHGKRTYYRGVIEKVTKGEYFWFFGGNTKIVRVTAPNHGLRSGMTPRYLNVPNLNIWNDSPVRVIDANTFDALADKVPADGEVITGSSMRWTLEVLGGVSYEWMIDVCNTLKANFWVCVPALADDNYIRNLALLIRDKLDPALKCYVECSNEVWNLVFKQFSQIRGVAIALNTDDVGGYAHVASNLFRIFTEVFDGQMHRIVRTLGGHAPGPQHMAAILSKMTSPADAISCTTYFSARDTQKVTSPDQVMAYILDDPGFMHCGYIDGIRGHGALAKQHGLQFVAYEGGQHLGTGGANKAWDEIYMATQDNLRMAEAYDRMIGEFENAGGTLLVAYHNVGPRSIYGSWGHIEWQDSDPAASVKYMSLINHIKRLGAEPPAE